MTPDQNDMTPDAARAALAWLVEMGAGEVMLEHGQDRFAAPRLPEPAAVLPPAAAPRMPALAESPADSCNTLEDLIAALGRFDACPLKKTATQLVFSDGDPRADLMLIGEAPGREEDLSGRPFVGKSGQLLDLMLSRIGVSRAAADPARGCFITNVIYWRPPGNRTPTEQECAMCLPFLRRAIEIVQPKLIVTLGNIPTQKLLARSEGILKLRGRWHDYDAGGKTIPVLATLHPSYLLRQPGQKRLAWRDLLALKERISG
jgi:uracil-DNA glycosylase